MIGSNPSTSGSLADFDGTREKFSESYEAGKAAPRETDYSARMALALLRWLQLGCGLLRASLRISSLGFVLVMAIANAAIARLTTPPLGSALARSRAARLHRWSALACSVMGLRIERVGFVPVSGLVIINHMTLINALLLSSVAPFVFVMDMDLRRRPIIGLLVRLSGALFRDRRRYRDVSRINFVIGRALKRRQVVVIFRSCEWQPEPAASGFPSALLQSAADACCTLTAAATSIKSAAATCPQRSGARHPVAEILMQRRSLVTIAFHPPAFHHGNRKQLAAQLWREVRVLERTGTVTAQSRRCGATLCDN